MNERELELLGNLAQHVERYNKRFYIVTVCSLAVCALIAMSALFVIGHLWDSYMNADYYYPDISQEQNIDIGKD